MSRILADSNVLLDVLTEDPKWSDWSAQQLDACAARATLCINALIYAEVSVGFERVEELDDALPADLFARPELPLAQQGDDEPAGILIDGIEHAGIGMPSVASGARH